jgi:hypothetical protein
LGSWLPARLRGFFPARGQVPSANTPSTPFLLLESVSWEAVGLPCATDVWRSCGVVNLSEHQAPRPIEYGISSKLFPSLLPISATRYV